MTNLIKSRSRAWFEDIERTYAFPENWNIRIFHHSRRKVLELNEIRNEIQNPIGCLPLTSYLTSGMKICLVCDDISRPTRTDIILPSILDILKARGIYNQNIQIVVASGAHSKMTKEEKIVKFGKKVCQEINIVDHDYNDVGVYIGTSELGTPVYVNQAVANSDFVLGIGGIYPNSVAGFGGGAKLILGVCGIDTIRHFHFRRRGINRGEAIMNDFRNDLLDAARICGMKFIINNLISEDREIIGIVAGDVEKAYIKGLKTTKDIYAVKEPAEFDFDLIVADTYPFDLSYVYAKKGFWPFNYCRPNCHRLIIADISSGVGYHGLFPPLPLGHLKRAMLYWNNLKVCTFSEISNKLWKKGQEIISKRTEKQNKASYNSKQNPKGETILLHSFYKNLNLPGMNVYSSEKWSDCIIHLNSLMGKEVPKVGYYRASSLTFPSEM